MAAESPAVIVQDEIAVASAEPAPPPPPFQPLKLSTGAHGLAIVALTLTEDGNAALTIDSGSHARLWPALDGSREPFVVPIAPGVVAGAIQRVDAAYAIATLDSAGHIEVRRVDGDRLVARANVESTLPFAKVVAAGNAFLAIRSDQAIQRIDLDGTPRNAVVPDSGEHVVTLLHRGGRTLALVDTQERAYGRWLTASTDLAWGERTVDLDIDPRFAMLDPSARTLASLRRKTSRGVLVDIATGTLKQLRGSSMMPLGFVGDRAAFSRIGDFVLAEWYDAAGKRVSVFGEDFELDGFPIRDAEAAGERVVTFAEGSLVMVAPTGLRFLGYRQQTIEKITPTALGLVATIDSKQTALDDQLRSARALPRIDGVAIDDLRAVVGHSQRVELVALEDRSTLQKLDVPSKSKPAYEPLTRLLAVNGGKRASFAVLDRSTARFGTPTSVDSDIAIDQIALLDPALAKGRAAHLVRMKKKLIDVRSVRVEALASDARISDSISLAGELEAIDRAGHFYVRTATDTITIFDGSNELGKLTDVAGWQARPSPDATRAIIFSKNRMALIDTTAKRVWEIAFPAVTDVEWIATDEVVVAAGGLVKLDPSTGALRGGQCGWRFGLHSSHHVERTGATVCDRR